MMLPNAAEARIDRAKIVEYLLSSAHPGGRSKAAYFARFGFTREKWQVLADALRAIAVSNPVTCTVASSYGVRYTVDGVLACAARYPPIVRTVWIIESDGSIPRLITAYPA